MHFITFLVIVNMNYVLVNESELEKTFECWTSLFNRHAVRLTSSVKVMATDKTCSVHFSISPELVSTFHDNLLRPYTFDIIISRLEFDSMDAIVSRVNKIMSANFINIVEEVCDLFM